MSAPGDHPALVAQRGGARVAGLEPFALFCAYHLGLDDDGSYRFQNVHDVARRFSVSPPDVEAALRAYRMTSEDLVHSSFDVAAAQVDMQVSPKGADLPALAEMHWAAFLDATPGTRDWASELAEAAAENARTFPAPDDER